MASKKKSKTKTKSKVKAKAKKKVSVKAAAAGVAKRNQKVASRRSEKWRRNMLAGKREAVTNPSVVRLHRLAKNLDQRVIAGKLKMSISSFGSIERGKRVLVEKDAKKIAALLKAPMKKLFKPSNIKGKFLAVTQKYGV